MKTIIILFIVAIMAKWSIFILISPIIVVKSCFDKRGKIRKKDNVLLNKNWIWKDFKKRAAYFVLGLIRYYDLQVGKLPSHTLRKFIYKNIFRVNLGNHSIIYYGTEIRAHGNLSIGKGSIIGDKAILDARNGIFIGNNVNLSTGVSIWTEQHDHRDPYFKCTGGPDFRVVIEDRAWIGPNVIILHSVTIGEGAVVGAGSVVTKNVAPFSVVGGIPAKEINQRPHDLKYEFDGTHLPFY